MESTRFVRIVMCICRKEICSFEQKLSFLCLLARFVHLLAASGFDLLNFTLLESAFMANIVWKWWILQTLMTWNRHSMTFSCISTLYILIFLWVDVKKFFGCVKLTYITLVFQPKETFYCDTGLFLRWVCLIVVVYLMSKSIFYSLYWLTSFANPSFITNHNCLPRHYWFSGILHWNLDQSVNFEFDVLYPAVLQWVPVAVCFYTMSPKNVHLLFFIIL